MHLANSAARDQLFGFCIEDGTNALAPHLENATGCLLCVDDRVTVFGLLHHWLLAIYVLAGFHGITSDPSVPMVGCCHNHCIQTGASQYFAIISAGENVLAIPLPSERQAAIIHI